MSEVNAAYEAAVARLGTTSTEHSPNAGEAGGQQSDTPQRRTPTHGSHAGTRRDAPSFTVDVLPVEAFEALLVVNSWVGEVLDDEPPYRLEVFLREPWQCWCRLDLVPDAGATTVSLTVAAPDGMPTPDPEDVRDLWVALLNQYE